MDNGIDDDYEHRTTHVYGRLLANKLDADFLNISKCGGWNSGMREKLKQSLIHVHNKYEEVYVFVTLTELGREMYHDPLWVSDELKDLEYVDDFLQMYEKNMFLSFKEIINNYPYIKFIIARNFTYTYDKNISLLGETHTDKTWVDCLQEYQNLKSYPSDVRFLSSMAILPICNRFKKMSIFKKFKFQMMEYYGSADVAIDWLLESNLNYKQATKHPIEKGHEIWADYLYKQIK